MCYECDFTLLYLMLSLFSVKGKVTVLLRKESPNAEL